MDYFVLKLSKKQFFFYVCCCKQNLYPIYQLNLCNVSLLMNRSNFNLFLPVIASIVYLSLHTNPLSAQNTTKNLIKARESYKLSNLVSAEELYKSVYSADPSSYEAASRLGEINTYLEDFPDALDWYRKAYAIDSIKNDTLLFWMGLTSKRLNDCKNATAFFNRFKARHGEEDVFTQRADLEISGCEYATSAEGQKMFYRVGVAAFNSIWADVFPAYLDQRQDYKQLIFTSHREAKGSKPYQGLGQPAFSDIYAVSMMSDTTYAPEVKEFGNNLNTNRNDGAATFTEDGLTMYFTICNTKRNPGGCNIFESKYDPVRKNWSKPELVEGVSSTVSRVVSSKGKSKNSLSDDRHPSISADGRTLYFSSDRMGGLGSGTFDIWVSRRAGSGWSRPENMGNTINTPFDEYTPSINREGNALFFASNGRGGFGSLDVFEAALKDGVWTAAKNLNRPINSEADDLGAVRVKNDSLLYFTSNRSGGVGGYDIYWAKQTQRSSNSFDITLQGLIRDVDSKQPIPFATAILLELDAENLLVPRDTFLTDQSARFVFPLAFDRDYVIIGNAPEYLAGEESLTTRNVPAGILEKNVDIGLEPIVLGRPIVLPNIYYDYDKYYIRSDATLELGRLLILLNQNPDLTIQLSSHTDTNGSLQYNQVLSENRAKAAVKWLVENGINPARLSWAGYGETRPLIYPELTDADEQTNRRTEFRITSVDFP